MALRTYVAMLRAVNLGSRNRVSMPDLVVLFEGLGSRDVRTYVQSGNVVFRSPIRAQQDVVEAVEERLAAELQLDVKVLVRDRAEMDAVVRDLPFGDVEGEPRKVLHVTFADATPDQPAAEALADMEFEPDEVSVLHGRDVYLHCPDGYGRSRLSNAFLEKRLGVTATSRNWKTVTTLADMSSA